MKNNRSFLTNTHNPQPELDPEKLQKEVDKAINHNLKNNKFVHEICKRLADK